MIESTWLDVELRAYGERRQERAFRSEHLLLRARLVQNQSAVRWADLLGQFRGFVLVIKSKEGDNFLRDNNSPTEHYEIEREDGITLSVDYDRELYRVTCSISSCEDDTWSFELEVRDVNENDKTVWIDRKTGLQVNDKKIAESAIRNLLRNKA